MSKLRQEPQPEGWVFMDEDGEEELGFAEPDEYPNADAAMHGVRRHFAEHFGVWYRDAKGELHSCSDRSTPDDFRLEPE